MKFVNSIPFGRFGPRGFCRDEGPCISRYAGALPCTRRFFAELVAPAPPDAGAPREHGLAMLGTRVTFVSRRKSPKACQNLRFWTPSVRGYRPFRARCASRRATFCHRKRPICHFELGGQTGLYFSPRFCRENFLLLIRGAVEEWLHVWVQLLGGFGV